MAKHRSNQDPPGQSYSPGTDVPVDAHVDTDGLHSGPDVGDAPPDTRTSDESMSLSEEFLEANVVSRQIGSVLIHKHIETQTVSNEVELHQGEIAIEQVEMDEFVDEKREPWHEGDTLVIPLYEEVLVTERKIMLTRLVRVHRKDRIERATVEGEVRREVLDIEPRSMEPTEP